MSDEYINRLRNRLYGVLCEREKGGEWEKFLETIVIELMGIDENKKTVVSETLIHKLNACRYLRYDYFRKTVLECMGLFDKLRGA